MKNLISKSLLMAAVVGAAFTSCEKEPTVQVNGETSDVAIGVNVKVPVLTKATADDVNFGDNVADIKNVTIVPMVGDAYQTPIVLANVTKDGNHYKTAKVLQTVDGFRVYGNIPTVNESSTFSMPSLAQEAGLNPNNGVNNDVAYTKPHSLYYYAEAGHQGETNPFKVANGTTSGDWTSVGGWAEALAVGTYNRVKVEHVTYAVGVVSVAALDGVEGENATKEIFGEDGAKKSWETVKGEEGKIDITGIVIEGQTKDFNDQLAPKGADEVSVYETAVTTTLATDKIAYVSGSDFRVENANIYCVVAPENAEEIPVHLQFQNKTGNKLTLNNGTVVNPDGYFYLSTLLKKGADKQIFDKGVSTIMNATVIDWGRGTLVPSEVVDTEIGIVVETEWKEGIVYDVEI